MKVPWFFEGLSRYAWRGIDVVVGRMLAVARAVCVVCGLSFTCGSPVVAVRVGVGPVKFYCARCLPKSFSESGIVKRYVSAAARLDMRD